MPFSEWFKSSEAGSTAQSATKAPSSTVRSTDNAPGTTTVDESQRKKMRNAVDSSYRTLAPLSPFKAGALHIPKNRSPDMKELRGMIKKYLDEP
jgi:hypothetical protein